MQINKRKQLVIGATALGALVASATTAHAEVNRRVEKIPFKTETREDPTLPKGERKVIQQGVEGEKEIVTTTTADVPGQAGTASGQVSFTTKASVTTSNEIKPRSIFAIIDNSGSVNGGDDPRIRSSFIPLLQTMGPNDQIQIATYGVNQATSYFSNGANDRERMVTKMMNRDEFAKFVEEVLSPKTGTTREAILKQNLVYDFKGVKQSGSSYEFEDIFDAARNKDYTPVVMQFTDSWEYEEEIDSSFAEWSKAHAKTFMSVIYGSGRAEIAMKKAGHPNIFLAQGEFTTDSDQTKKVLEQIKATTTEVVKKSLVTVDGKEVGNKTVELKGTSGQKGETKTVENIIKQPVNEIIAIGTQEAAKTDRKIIKIPFKTIEEEDENLNEGVRKVVRPGVEGEKEIITTTIPGTTATQGQGSGTITVTTKSSTSTKTETKGRSIFMPVDGSGSTGFGTRKNILEDLDAIIKSLSDKDQIQLAFYEDNNANSYASYGDGPKASPTTIMMTKAQAVKLIDYVQSHNTGYAWVDAVNALGLRAKNAPAGTPYEDIYEASRDKSLTPVIIQLTDGWTTEEDIDHSFAKWAKDHAKTFMSIVYDTQASTANKKMIEAGHPNIFLAVPKGKELTADERKAGILKQIAATTTETITKGEDQTIRVTLGGTGVTVTKATIKGGSLNKDLPIKDGKVDYSEKLPDGTYTIEYQASGNGTLTSTTYVNGQQASTKDLKLGDSSGTTLRLTSNSTAKNNGDGTYTQTITVDYDPARDGDVVAPDQRFHDAPDNLPPARYGIFGGSTAKALTVRLTGPGGVEYLDQNGTFLKAPKLTKGTYTLTYTFRLEDNPVAGTVPGVLEIGKAKAEKRDTFEEVPKTVTPDKTTHSERIIKEPIDEIVHIGIGGQTTESKKEPIPFATEIIEDEAMMEGEEKVTVEGMIGEKEILTTYKTKKGQKVGNPISTSEHVTKHMRTKIIHRGVKGSVTEKENVEIPYTTKIVEDDTLPLGEQKVVQAGVKGNKEITRTWITQRKLKVGDPTTSEKVTKEPVEEIIHIGTREGVMDTEYEVIPYETRYVDDPTLEAGKEVVVVEGVNGQKAINKFYSVSKGKVVSEIDAQAHVLRHPTDKVIHRGTGVKPEAPKVEEPKVETPKVETPKVEEPTVETPKVETPKVEEPKVETPKVEPKVEEPKVETPKVEEPKVEEPKPETPKVEKPKVETPKVEAPKVETPKVETPKVETPKVETPKVEPKVETPKVETPKVEKQAQSAKELPKTGDAGMLTSLFGMGSIALGGLSIRRKRRK